ncbi:hypothetical protein EJB05_47872, partial [Eragrostis curvula]
MSRPIEGSAVKKRADSALPAHPPPRSCRPIRHRSRVGGLAPPLPGRPQRAPSALPGTCDPHTALGSVGLCILRILGMSSVKLQENSESFEHCASLHVFHKGLGNTIHLPYLDLSTSSELGGSELQAIRSFKPNRR